MLQTLRSQPFSLKLKTAPFTSVLCFNGPYLIVECEGIFKILSINGKKYFKNIHVLVVHKKVWFLMNIEQTFSDEALHRSSSQCQGSVFMEFLTNQKTCVSVPAKRPTESSELLTYTLTLTKRENRRYFETSTTLQFI